MADILDGLIEARSREDAAVDLHDPRTFLAQAVRRRNSDELSAIAEAKRFRERLIGDAAFRTALRSKGSALAHNYERYRPLWDQELGHSVWHSEALDGWPEVRLWKAWHEDLVRFRDLMTAYPSRYGTQPAFTAWRQRQAARAASELGPMHVAITHPAVAYELASGCSVGCWFCGISAQSFSESASYEEHGQLWRQILAAVTDQLGPTARTGFCYWGTDPADTPDYDRFLADHGRVTGWIPQTTTAAPLRDIGLTRRVLSLSTPGEPVLNRFSVLSPRQLHQIFEAFTPLDLLLVELVPQMRGSLMPKARAGRALARETAQPERDLSLSEAATTIACVSGFLINLPERRIRLIAPCKADTHCPDGYRTFADVHFADAAELPDVLDALIADHMPEELPSSLPLGFRHDLGVRVEAGAIRLENDASIHTVSGYPFLPQLASLLTDDPRSVGATIEAMVASGANFFDVHGLLTELYDSGLIEPLHPLPARPMVLRA
ncbi:radical SAM family RiPP maturation amino acid epimerase [Microvirga puerhi]|uniref:Radical SAM family RiPP maturation amino acid epimerase n=1 Tax=Microvirga puerhi TaxID=2876078 RepID=A0ABS7VIA3_9HYPH|nr:radical SAM family RiPP maturation amino acid epimerase [Microvirga puerhi]MBZ6074820.1 radical SAM family RiPP maturation amino acid epimerase [Microvirga puerhi]